MKRYLTGCIITALFLAGCRQQAELTGNTLGFETENTKEIETEEVTGTEEVTETEEDTETEESEIEENPTVTVLMVGDMLLHTPVMESASKEDETYQFTKLFENVKADIEEADLALVNQEVILGGEELGISGYPCFNAPYEFGDALVETGFDVILHATNHALDKGKKGITNCLSFWQENYPEIGVVGIHESQEKQDEVYVCEKNGIRIAILNYTYGTNGINLPSDMPYAVDLLEKDKIEKDIQKAEETADFTIVCPHWGTEYSLEQTEEQMYWTELFYENGADLVIGTHPHVIEPVEWYGEANEMLVYYSLGNFVSWTSCTGAGISDRMLGGMSEVTLEKKDGEVRIAEYGVTPLVTHLEKGFGGVTVYKLEDYTQELAEKNEILKQDEAFSIEYCKNLCEEVWKKE